MKVTHNAFASWEYKENSLQLVKSHVSVKTWDLINDLLEKERCRHVAVYAKGFNIINLLEEELEEIRSYYNIKMTAQEMIKI
ncbi:hypothetical protein [Spirochaeta cellobiosiphila]|uniref:hypothetical protein n=1 Tax=Spirochaeta cellobiosiphila TaxID=504483 RepID=UPI0012EB08EF|nr:hypothetical protein [Spirochaeta cellobiosiphila]